MSLFNAGDKLSERELRRSLTAEVTPPKLSKRGHAAPDEFDRLTKLAGAQSELIDRYKDVQLSQDSRLKRNGYKSFDDLLSKANEACDFKAGVMGDFDSEQEYRDAVKAHKLLKECIPDGVTIEEFVRGVGADDVTQHATIPYKPKN